MASTKKKGPGKRYAQHEVVAQRNQALKLWMSGASYPNIAERLEVSLSTAWKRVQDAIDEMRPHADFDHYRSVQRAELEIMRQALRKDVMRYSADQIPRSDGLKVIDTLLRLQEREAKLLGLDRAPHAFDEIASMSDEQLNELLVEWADEFDAEED